MLSDIPVADAFKVYAKKLITPAIASTGNVPTNITGAVKAPTGRCTKNSKVHTIAVDIPASILTICVKLNAFIFADIVFSHLLFYQKCATTVAIAIIRLPESANILFLSLLTLSFMSVT